MNRLLDEMTNLMVVLLALGMILAFAGVKWAVVVAVLVKFFSL